MPAAAKKAQGAKIFIGLINTDPASATWTQIQRVTAIDSVDVKAAVLDATALDDTYKRRIKGILDSGNLKVQMHRVHDDAGQIALAAAAVDQTGGMYPFKIEVNDDAASVGNNPTKLTWKGFVSEFSYGDFRGAGNVIGSSFVIEVDGAVTETAAAA